jgi:hypothetical protein
MTASGAGVPTVKVRRPGRGPEPAIVVALALVAFVGVALLKPWDPQMDGPAASAEGESGDRPVASAGPAGVAPPRVAVADLGLGAPRSPGAVRLGLPRFDWPRVAELGAPPDRWGVLAIVARPDRLPGGRPPGSDEILVDGWFLSQRWSAAAPTTPGLLSYSSDPERIVSDAVLMGTDGAAVAALGITSPLSDVPLDVRIWRLFPDGGAERLVLRDLAGGQPGGQRIFRPPWGATGGDEHWLPGLYRVDLLMGNYITRLTVLLPGTASEGGRVTVFDLRRDRASSPPAGSVDSLGKTFQSLPVGPFAIDAELGAVHLAALPGRSLDERETWLLAGSGQRQREGTSIARLASDRILAFGLELPDARRIRSAVLHRLAPVASRMSLATLPSWRRSGDARPRAWTAWAMLRPGDRSEAWEPGVYRIDAEWLEGGRLERGSWHIDLVAAGAPLTTAPFLAATGDWAHLAGRPSVIVGTAQHWQGGPRHAQIRSFRQRPDSVNPDPAALGGDCRGGALIDGGQRLIGIGHAHGHLVPTTVLVKRRFEFGQSLEVPASVSAAGLPGLAILGSASGGFWPPGYYTVELTYPEPVSDPDPTERFVFCVGRPTAWGLRVPPSSRLL